MNAGTSTFIRYVQAHERSHPRPWQLHKNQSAQPYHNSAVFSPDLHTPREMKTCLPKSLYVNIHVSKTTPGSAHASAMRRCSGDTCTRGHEGWTQLQSFSSNQCIKIILSASFLSCCRIRKCENGWSQKICFKYWKPRTASSCKQSRNCSSAHMKKLNCWSPLGEKGGEKKRKTFHLKNIFIWSPIYNITFDLYKKKSHYGGQDWKPVQEQPVGNNTG